MKEKCCNKNPSMSRTKGYSVPRKTTYSGSSSNNSPGKTNMQGKTPPAPRVGKY